MKDGIRSPWERQMQKRDRSKHGGSLIHGENWSTHEDIEE